MPSLPTRRVRAVGPEIRARAPGPAILACPTEPRARRVQSGDVSSKFERSFGAARRGAHLALACAGSDRAGGLERGPAGSERDEERERAVLTTIGRILPEGHLSQHPLDDAISRRAFDDLVEDLDPAKLYFLKSDVEAHGAVAGPARRHGAQPATTPSRRASSALFLKRLEERVGWVHELLLSDLRFDQDEFWETDPKRIDFAATASEARDRWRRRVKYELLMLEGPDLPREKAIEKLAGRYDRIPRRA